MFSLAREHFPEFYDLNDFELIRWTLKKKKSKTAAHQTVFVSIAFWFIPTFFRLP